LGKRAFAQLIAEQVTQSLFRPFVSGAVSSLPGMFGIIGSTPGGGGGSVAGGGLLNLASLGSNLMPSSWLSGIGSSISSGVNSFGAALGFSPGIASVMPTGAPLIGANGMLTGGGATSILPG